jgi:signal peptidase I
MNDKPAAAPEPAFKKSVAREYLESIVVAVILALFIRTFAVQAFKIPTGSMEPNLLIGDHLLVNKLVYSPSLAPWEDKLFDKKALRRGDVVVFKYPEEPLRDFIKRVIGLPGETVEVRDHQVLVNGQPIDDPHAHWETRDDDPEGSYRTGWGPQVVPPGHVLVLGDNRDNSRDSRFWGFLPIDQIKGRALLVYWSINADKQDYQGSGPRAWLKVLDPREWRWKRFFHLIR